MLQSDRLGRLRLLRIAPIVEDGELGAQKVGPYLAKETSRLLVHLFLIHADHVVRGRVPRSLLSSQEELICLRK